MGVRLKQGFLNSVSDEDQAQVLRSDISYTPVTLHDKDLPRNWEKIQYTPLGFDVGCIRAHAKGSPQSKVTFITGFKADLDIYNAPHIHALQRSGVEIDIIPLPDPGMQTGFLKDYKKIIRSVLKDSPIDQNERTNNIPHFIFAHSIGARGVLSNGLDESFAKHLNEKYAGAVLIGTHIVSPYREKQLTSFLYNSYCQKYSDKLYGQAPLDWIHPIPGLIKKAFHSAIDKIQKAPVDDFFEDVNQYNSGITHGQVFYSNSEGESLLNRMRNSDIPLSIQKFPILLLAGTKDFVSSVDSIREISKIYNAKFYEFDCFHHPFFEHNDARNIIKDFTVDVGERWNRLNIRGYGHFINDHVGVHTAQVTASPFEDPMTL